MTADADTALTHTDPLVAKALMIATARQRGLTWAQIAPTIGCTSGKQAKAAWKRVAKAANLRLIEAETRRRAAA